jgi:hypothetical protein
MRSYVGKLWLVALPLRIAVLFLMLAGCSVARQSKFVSQNIPIGIDKEEIKTRFGAPYKIGFYKDNDQTTHEDWFYKENLFIEKWYEVTTILHFQNNKLISVEPGKEIPVYTNKILIKDVN